MSEGESYPPGSSLPRPVDSYVPPPPLENSVPPSSSDPALPPPGITSSQEVSSSILPTDSYAPSSSDPAPLKPLLNPLQADDSPSNSMVVEPPRSPNPANGQTDDIGNNVAMDVPSSSASVVGPSEIPAVPSTIEEPRANGLPVSSARDSDTPMETTPVPPAVPSPSTLPRDAPMPPTPEPRDEAPPPLAPSIIPPAIPTSSVVSAEIASEEPLRSAAAPSEVASFGDRPLTPMEVDPTMTTSVPEPTAESSIPPAASLPTPPEEIAPVETVQPTEVQEPPPQVSISDVNQPSLPETPALPTPPAVFAEPTMPTELAQPPTEVDSSIVPPPSAEITAPSDGMDVDVKVGDAAQPPATDTGSSTPSLKRPGEELEGGDEKRVKDEASAQSEVPAAPLPTPLPESAQTSAPPAVAPAADGTLPPAAGSAPPPPWLSYTPPEPKPAGPTTPLTLTQHRYLMNNLKGMKKVKDAINFLQPVDTVLFNIPHYNQIIEKPMDLSTIETKLTASDPRGPPTDKSRLAKWDTSKGTYGSVSEVANDMRQIWENTRKFNGPNHVVSQSATRLEATFEKTLNNLPPEPSAAPALPPPAAIKTASPAEASPKGIPAASPSAGPSSHARRPSVSRPPTIRRSSDGPDARPKREIHPPPSRDIGYSEAGRKPKRRNDPQMQYIARTIKSFENVQKYYTIASPFLYPIEEIVKAFPQYTEVIKRPIDLVHVKNRLEEGIYDDIAQVDSDMRLIVKNAKTFNPPGDPVHDAAEQLMQLWEEKWKNVPPLREESEEVAVEEDEPDLSDEEDTAKLTKLETQLGKLQAEIDEIKARQAKRRATKSSKPKKPKAAARKQSTSKASPGANGHSAPKKARKSKEVVFRDDEEMDSEEEASRMTLTQKQELAEKIQQADEATLGKAIEIIQNNTNFGNDGQEIELDIDALPPRVVLKLYNLVCGRRKSGAGKAAKAKSGKKASGGLARKTVNEQEEADRIRRMQAQLNSFDNSRPGMGGYNGGDDSESSEEEDSDEE